MKREDVENAAKKEAENLACLVYYGGSAISQEDVENAFVKGAEWRIDSVWHGVKEEPKYDEYFLYENAVHAYHVDGIYPSEDEPFAWDDYVKDWGLIRWAYIKDLLPNTEK